MSSAELNSFGPQDMVRGRAQLVGDLKLPGMLHARLLISPLAHGRINSLDAKKALALPGVKAVVTASDCVQAPSALLAGDEVMHQGQAVAAVAATDPQIAAKALELIEVHYQELPAVLTIEDALEENAPQVRPERAGNLSHENQTTSGDLEAGFASAHLVLHESFSIPSLAAVRPETSTCLARPGHQGLTLWTSTSPLAGTGKELAQALGLQEAAVQVIRPYNQIAPPAHGPALGAAELCAALLASKTGRPVRLALSREEETCLGPHSAGGRARCKLGFSAEGGLTAMDLEIDLMAGAYDFSGDLIKFAMTAGLMVYDMPALRCRCRVVHGHLPPAGTMHGLEGLPACLALETLMNQAAPKLGLDPLSLRLKNASGKDLSACLQRLKDQKPAPETGIACFKSETAGPRGPVHLLCGAAAVETRLNQDTGQIKVERIKLVHGGGAKLGLTQSMILGLGAGLSEELVFDSGHILNPSLSGYRLPGALDLPQMDIEGLGGEDPDQWSLSVLVGPALAHAAGMAGGFWPTTLPLSPQRVLKGTGRLK
jgi:CO/xanthine dehydrogenase Mo-binding subunit